MKSVLISIQPKWCDLIASGKKTVEVRKTAPKLQTPFKCYIYCTKCFPIMFGKNGALSVSFNVPLLECEKQLYPSSECWNGKVIGEFVCNKIDKYSEAVIACAKFEVNGADVEEKLRYNAGACLTTEEMFAYSNGKPLYGWNVSSVIIYDKPKELGEFRRKCKQYGADNPLCDDCIYFDCCRGVDYDESDCVVDGSIPIKRPPQSWFEVEGENYERKKIP